MPSDGGYRWRGYRCEGLYISRVGARSLEIVSLLRGKLRFDLQPNVQIEVSVPNVANLAQGPIRVRAVSLPLKTYYRMDAVLPAARRMLWPVKDVLLPSHLYANMIGVFGWVGTEANKTFIPLQVVQQGEPQRQGGVELMVRSPVDIETLKWRSSTQGEHLAAPPRWLDAVTTPVPAGRPVAISLPEGAPAVLHIEVTAKEQNEEVWSTLGIRVIRPGLR